MAGRDLRRGTRKARLVILSVERLDARAMPSTGVTGPLLGHYLAPATAVPKIKTPATIVDPHTAINGFLSRPRPSCPGRRCPSPTGR